MGQSGPLELGVAPIAKPCRLQAGPPEPLTRGSRSDRDERVILKRSEQTPRFRRFLLHLWSLFAIRALSRRTTGPRPPPSKPVGPQATVAAGRLIIRSAVEEATFENRLPYRLAAKLPAQRDDLPCLAHQLANDLSGRLMWPTRPTPWSANKSIDSISPLASQFGGSPMNRSIGMGCPPTPPLPLRAVRVMDDEYVRPPHHTLTTTLPICWFDSR